MLERYHELVSIVSNNVYFQRFADNWVEVLISVCVLAAIFRLMRKSNHKSKVEHHAPVVVLEPVIPTPEPVPHVDELPDEPEIIIEKAPPSSKPITVSDKTLEKYENRVRALMARRKKLKAKEPCQRTKETLHHVEAGILKWQSEAKRIRKVLGE